MKQNEDNIELLIYLERTSLLNVNKTRKAKKTKEKLFVIKMI